MEDWPYHLLETNENDIKQAKLEIIHKVIDKVKIIDDDLWHANQAGEGPCYYDATGSSGLIQQMLKQLIKEVENG